MAIVTTVRRCGHPQADWVPNFKDKPGPLGQSMVEKREANLCADCFFEAMNNRFGIQNRKEKYEVQD